MDSEILGTNEIAEYEDAGLSLDSPAEEIVGYDDEDEQDDKKENDAAAKTSSAGTNVVYAYLNEVRHWPILSRDEEYDLAKAYHEAETAKADLVQQWVRIMAACIDGGRLNNSGNEEVSTESDSPASSLLDMIAKVSAAAAEIAGLDSRCAQHDISAYMKRKLSAEKNGRADALVQYCRTVDLVKQYRSGAVRSLYHCMKTRVRAGVRIELIAVLRGYCEACAASRKVKERLISSNLRLVIGIAKKYSNRGLSLPDLIQEGNIGLIRAIEKFDYRLGNRLSTYASWWIRQTVIRSIEEKSSTIRVPIYINEKIKKLLRADADGTDGFDVAEEALQDSGNLYFALQLTKDPISLETPFSDDGANLHECIPDKGPASALDQIEENQLNEITDRMLTGLSERDESILRMRFGVGGEVEHTLEEIGEKFQLSRERIRQIETSALRRIRQSGEGHQLRAFLYEEAV
jgi:RNA polymerase sigma factor (sigma-70 family)